MSLRRATVLAAVLCLAAAAYLATRPRASGPPAPVAPPPGLRVVADGVRLGGQVVGGWRADQVRDLLDALAAEADEPPREPAVDAADRSLVPGLAGLALDVPATLARVVAAPPNDRLAALWRLVPPATPLAALPADPIRHANRGRHAVGLEVNVAWGETHLPAMLRILAAAHVHATFCLVGRWAERNPALARDIAAGGQELCNHGYTDHGWSDLGRAAARRSIERADSAILGVTGCRPVWFTPHRGEWNPNVVQAARDAGQQLVLWSLDTVDWQHPNVATILRRTAGRARPGDIILMHPTAETVAALPQLVAELRAKGLPPVTLGELLQPWRGAGGCRSS